MLHILCLSHVKYIISSATQFLFLKIKIFLALIPQLHLQMNQSTTIDPKNHSHTMSSRLGGLRSIHDKKIWGIFSGKEVKYQGTSTLEILKNSSRDNESDY